MSNQSQLTISVRLCPAPARAYTIMTVRPILLRSVLTGLLIGAGFVGLSIARARNADLPQPGVSAPASTARAASQPSAAVRPVSILAVGDICLAKGVETAMKQRGRAYPFAALKKKLREPDITVGNLECCLSLRGVAVPKKYNFRGHPRGALALAEAGFDVVSLANNHALDYGKTALSDTIDHLTEQEIVVSGGGKSLEEAHALRIVTVRGVRVGFLSYLGLFPSILPLTSDEPALAMAELPLVKRDVRAARPLVDLLVVSMHAGKEYRFKHSARQRQIARTAIDAGADAVIGHHPHVVQDSEVYRGKPIFYSLGNFIFDPSPTFLRDRGRRWSAMVELQFTPGQPLVSRLVDLRIVDRQPRLARKDEWKRG